MCSSSPPGRQLLVVLWATGWLKVRHCLRVVPVVPHLAAWHPKLPFCAAAVALAAAEPGLALSPDCKHLAVKEPCSRQVCLLSAQDGFKEVLTTLVPFPVSRDSEVVADTVLSCSWSADSKLLLIACKSSAVYLFDR